MTEQRDSGYYAKELSDRTRHPLGAMAATSAAGSWGGYSVGYASNKVTEGSGGRARVKTLDGLGRVMQIDSGTASGTMQSSVKIEYAQCACSTTGKVKRVSQPYA